MTNHYGGNNDLFSEQFITKEFFFSEVRKYLWRYEKLIASQKLWKITFLKQYYRNLNFINKFCNLIGDITYLYTIIIIFLYMKIHFVLYLIYIQVVCSDFTATVGNMHRVYYYWTPVCDKYDFMIWGIKFFLRSILNVFPIC